MRRAREAMLRRAAARRAATSSRASCWRCSAVVPWRAVPVMPVEIMLLPNWFPLHLDKISYWARTVIVPLLVLMAQEAAGAQSQAACASTSCFCSRRDRSALRPRRRIRRRSGSGSSAASTLFCASPSRFFRSALRQRAIDARGRVRQRAPQRRRRPWRHFPGHGQQRDDVRRAGLFADSDPRSRHRAQLDRQTARRQARTRPIASPAFRRCGTRRSSCHTLMEAGGERAAAQLSQRASTGCVPQQILDVVGDWSARRPDVRPGGWAFQYANPHYPDLDDTAVVVMAMDRPQNAERRQRFIASFDARAANGSSACRAATAAGARSTPTTTTTTSTTSRSPTTARCSIRRPRMSARAACRCWRSSARRQTQPGWSRARRLSAPRPAGGRQLVRPLGHELHLRHLVGAVRAQRRRRRSARAGDAQGRRLADRIQNEDGGWGEDGDSYKLDYRGYERAPSTASQTAWALLGLMAAGAPIIRQSHGASPISRHAGRGGLLERAALYRDRFPRVFYLRYHGYSKFFPLWALARYRDLRSRNAPAVVYGM